MSMKKNKRVSRRKFLGSAARAALVIGAGPAALTSLLGQGTGDTTLGLVNGRIYTMNATNAVVTSVTIRNGRIVAAGNTAPAAGANTRIIDLQGRTVVPGLIEAHIHSVSLANRPGYHTILENTASIKEIQEVLAARRRDVPAGQWIMWMGG